MTERISESAYTVLKFMIVWTLVLLADFMLEFRLEYLWPCWLFFGSVYTTFHCHGLVICVVFVCAAFTLDIFCLIFVPLHWLFLAASTYVLFNYIWHTGAKWRPKADSVHYQCSTGPSVSDDMLMGDYLQLPQGEGKREGDLEEVQPHPKELKSALPAPGVKPRSNDFRDLNPPRDPCETRQCISAGPPIAPELPGVPQQPPLTQEEQESKATSKTSKSSPPKTRKVPVTVAAPGGKIEKRQKNAVKTTSPNRDAAEKGNIHLPTASNHHAEQITKLEAELRRLRGELQSSQQAEQELRSHVCNLTNSERSLRPELTVLRHTNELLQSKILNLTKTKQRDKHASAALEKKARAEIEARIAVEKQLAELQAQKLDEAAILLRNTAHRQEQTETLMLRKKVKDLEAEYTQLQLESQAKESQVLALEKEVESLQKYRGVEKEMDTLLSALSSLQDKAQHLEYNLSAETRIKLDLFSALGDARRQLEIAQGKLRKQDQEIREMKQRIAEVMAVSPTVSYVAPRPAVPQYITKFLNSERYVLNPRALMYQCLKK